MSKSSRQREWRDQFLTGEISRKTYDERLARSQESDADSVLSASLIIEETSESPDVVLATSDPQSIAGSLDRPVAMVGPGIEIGGFRLEKSLGRGGMGEVWKARDLVGERPVVIKLLHAEFVNRPDELASVKDMFQRVHRLQHQNICPLYLLGLDARFGYYVVMKFIDGLTLSAYRRQFLETHAKLTGHELALLLGPVAAALDHAHGQKIIHCDVKPQNIMIGRDDQVVELVDFGLAAEIRSSVSRISSTSIEHGGTYPYMSPEQWRGEILDGKTDQYALAVVAYEMLAGRRPFMAVDPEILRLCVMNETPGPIADVSSSANAVVLRGMSKSKSHRYESCTSFITSLCTALASIEAEGDANRTSAKLKGPNPSSIDSSTYGRQDDEDVGFNTWHDESKPKQIRKDMRETVMPKRTDDENLSPIALANRSALIWASLIAGCVAIALIATTTWLASNLLSTRPTVLANMAEEKEANVFVPATPPPEPSIRYRWQPDRAYVYTVSLDIDQDHDRVLTLSGDLAYSVSASRSGLVPPEETVQGTGTAFIVHPDGYLLTCHHVTEGATSIEVALGNRTYPATVIADDEEHDLSLIRIEASQLVPLPFADSDAVQQGEEVRAVGFPLLSILGENIKATRGTIAGINDEDGHRVFQIDAAVNPGNSGGPLVNEHGQVIGVIYAKIMDTVAASVGFATCINDAKKLMLARSLTLPSDESKKTLTGPALVKKVAAATALVTVTARRTTQLPRGRISLRCEGTLKPTSWRRSGQPGDPVEQMSSGHPLIFSTVASGSGLDQVEVDSMGRVHAMTGLGNLPNFLGHAPRLIVEYLPASRQRNWSLSFPTTFMIQQDTDHQGNAPWGSPFGGRFAPRHPFGPRHFGPQGLGKANSDATTKTYPGTARIDYELGQRVDQLQTIQKTYELKTDEVVGAGPRIQLKGQGKFVFNTLAGLPHELEMLMQLIENEPDKTTTIPMKLTYKFLMERPVPPGQGAGQPAIPSPVTIPGKPVEADSPLEVGSRLVGDWAGKWQRVTVLKLNEDGQVRIHWEGWSDQWDEDVPRSRLRFLPN